MLPLNEIHCKDNLDYLRELPDACVDLVVTDPPYNVSVQGDFKFNGKEIKKDFGQWDYNFDPEPVLRELKRVLKPNGQIYIFCATKQISEYMTILFRDWYFRQILVWYRRNPCPRLSKTNFLFAADYIMYGINEKLSLSKVTFNFTTQTDMHNVIITNALQGKERLRNPDNKSLHPTQKPLEVLRKLIAVSSNPGDIVLDPFMGVGSTAVAAKQLGRNFLGCEINQLYVDAANLRLSR